MRAREQSWSVLIDREGEAPLSRIRRVAFHSLRHVGAGLVFVRPDSPEPVASGLKWRPLFRTRLGESLALAQIACQSQNAICYNSPRISLSHGIA